MKYHPLQLVFLAFLPLITRTTLYFAACKIRSIDITLMSCIVIGGSGVLLSIIPLPLPHTLLRILAVGLAMYLMTRYTEAELYPDVVFIPLIVELLSNVLTEFLFVPLIA